MAKTKRTQPKPELPPDREFAEALTEARGYVSAALAALDGVALDGKMAPGVDNDPDIELARQKIRDAIVPSNLIAAQLWRAIRALDAEQARRWAAAPPISAQELEICIARQQADSIVDHFCRRCGKGYMLFHWHLNPDGTVQPHDGQCRCGQTSQEQEQWLYRPNQNREHATVHAGAVSGPRQPPLDLPATPPPPKPAEPAKPVQRGFKF